MNLDDLIREDLAMVISNEQAIGEIMRGRTVEVISDFNDQPYGRSKPSLKGKRYEVLSAFVEQGGVTVWLSGLRCGARLWEDVVLIDDSQSQSKGGE